MINEHREWDLDELVDRVTDEEWGWGTPVRAMEALRERGEAAVEPLLRVVESPPDDGDEYDPRFWPVVALGELRDPRAAPALANLIRSLRRMETPLGLVAAEALGKVGTPALPVLRDLAASEVRLHRLWAYYAAGRMEDDAAFGWLREALDADPDLSGIIALSLAERPRPEALEPVLRARERAPDWQRPDFEDALVRLQGIAGPAERTPSDWRLRYRWNPGLGSVPLTWAMVAAVVEDAGAHTREARRGFPLRPLDEVLAEARRQSEPERCDCCGIPSWMGTGVLVCPASAAGIAMLQSELLDGFAAAPDGQQQSEDDVLYDLFDVLDEVEWRIQELDAPGPSESRAGRTRREQRREELLLLRAGCVWLVEQGVETVGRGWARLQREARHAAEVHGTPLPPPAPPASMAEAAPPRVGRNDPCPCGSGRKFKKCCGAA